MRGYRAVYASWPEMMPPPNSTNGTDVMAAACEGLKGMLGPNGTAVFGYNQGQVAPLFYPEVVALTQDHRHVLECDMFSTRVAMLCQRRCR